MLEHLADPALYDYLGQFAQWHWSEQLCGISQDGVLARNDWLAAYEPDTAHPVQRALTRPGAAAATAKQDGEMSHSAMDAFADPLGEP
jgi:hypothetical protein